MSVTRQLARQLGGDIETRARIRDAAIECFIRYGNDKTTVNDVARLAGVSRQTVYRYFADRTSLLEEVDAYEDEQMRAEAARLAADATSFEEFLARLAARQAANTNRYRTREHLGRQDRGLFHSLFLSQERSIERFGDVIRAPLADAAARGELRPGADLDEAVEWIAITLSSMSRLIRATTFDLADPDAVGRFVARHVCHGLVGD